MVVFIEHLLPLMEQNGEWIGLPFSLYSRASHLSWRRGRKCGGKCLLLLRRDVFLKMSSSFRRNFMGLNLDTQMIEQQEKVLCRAWGLSKEKFLARGRFQKVLSERHNSGARKQVLARSNSQFPLIFIITSPWPS